MPSILDKIRNFLRLYEYWIGESPVPTEYYHWSALSLIAACLSNRVWSYRQFGSQRLVIHPNLYIMLLGPSGNGKSTAKDAAVNLLRKTDWKGKITLYDGKITAPAMYDNMDPVWIERKQEFRHPERLKFYLVNDELANDIGMGEHANMLIKSLTRMYSGQPFTDSTRMYGTKRLDWPFSVNWLSCTTAEWLIGAVTREAILGGFFARICVAQAGYTGRKAQRLEPPEDHARVEDYLVSALNRYLEVEGEIVFTTVADDAVRRWEDSLPPAKDGDIHAPWRQREVDTMYKLAQIHAVADNSIGIVEVSHVEQAIRLTTGLGELLPKLVEVVAMTGEGAIQRELLNTVKRNAVIVHSKLLREAYNRGFGADQLARLVETWRQAGMVEVVNQTGPKGGRMYKWLG